MGKFILWEASENDLAKAQKCRKMNQASVKMSENILVLQ